MVAPQKGTAQERDIEKDPPPDRPSHDLAEPQTKWERAVCLVNAPGRFSRTGTLLMARGACAVVFGGGDHDGARSLPKRIAAQASAMFFVDGGSRPFAARRRLGLFEQLLDARRGNRSVRQRFLGARRWTAIGFRSTSEFV